MPGGVESGMQAGERAGEAADRVGYHAVAVFFVGRQVLVGVDEDLVDLRGEAREHPFDHRLAAQRLQALVDAAHAAALAAGEDDAGDAHAGPRKWDGGAPSSRRNMALNAEGLS